MRANWTARAVLAGFAVSALFFWQDFATHARDHFTGSIESIMITGQWHIVVLNIVLFAGFLIPLTYRRKADWKEYGIVVAFFVSLFVEMYGIPLTVIMTAHALAPGAEPAIRTVLVLDILGVGFAFTVPMVYGAVMMLAGMALIMLGWATLYRNVKKDLLVTTGIYSVSRNPQYLGFILMVAGWIVGWPTIITMVFSTILIYFYVRLCHVEEKEIGGLKGFKRYRKMVPLIV